MERIRRVSDVRKRKERPILMRVGFKDEIEKETIDRWRGEKRK